MCETGEWQDSHISVDELPASLRGVTAKRAGAAPNTKRKVITLQQAAEHAEIQAIRAAFEASQGRRAEAAEMLGISRKTLWEKVKHYRISVDS